jgi:hypothetical protein
MQTRFDYFDMHPFVMTLFHVEAMTIILTFGQN